MSEIYITSAKRTAVGSLGKSLKNIKAEDLGSEVIASVVKDSKLKHFFTKCNANYRYSTRMFSTGNNIYIAQAEDLCGGINWVLSVVKNTDNTKFLSNCKTLKEVKEEIKFNEELELIKGSQ